MFGKKITSITLLFISSLLFAQNRGDNISFQGTDNFNSLGIKATAMGGAFTSQSGELDALFYNPAGLSGIKGIQFSVATNFSSNKWFENQVYRPNRYFVTLPFYLEGLYVPDPADNGIYDHLRMWTDQSLIDSSYFVKFPETGLDPQGEEAADWVETADNSALNHFAVAVPFEFAGYSFTVAAAYGRENTIADYDRNKTFLDPHLGYDAYGEMSRVNGIDTLVVQWYDYMRKRTGSIDEATGAISFKVNDNISVGAGFKTSWGSSDDKMALDKIGYFNLVAQNRFRFSYDTAYQYIGGTSDYSSTKFNLGLNLSLDHVSFGLNVDLPYTFTRDFEFTKEILDSNGIRSTKYSGTDKAEFPFVISAGVSFSPVENLSIVMDYRYAPFSQTKFTHALTDTTFKNWADQHTFSFGIDYRPVDFLSLQAGYRQIPQTFVPDGSAIRDSGPKAENVSVGLGIHTFLGTIQAAYQYRVLKYYDSYFSNTNYNTIIYSNILVGYKLSL